MSAGTGGAAFVPVPRLTQAGELLLEAEAAVQRGAASDDVTQRLDAFAQSRSLAELALAQFVHRGVVAIEKLAAMKERTAAAQNRTADALEKMIAEREERA